MGLRDLTRRLRATVEELDAERLQDRFHGLQLVPISDMGARQPVRVGGEITRIRLAPRSGVPATEVVVSDGTGSATAVFTGRRNIGGMEHGRGVLLEGVPYQERGRKVLVNPAYTLLAE